MGITMSNVHIMERYGLLATGRKVLDFGSSNLYTATADEISSFVKRHNPSPRGDIDAWAARLAAGSLTDASGTALNQSFVGEMLESAGMGYDAIDIADGYKTTIVDLNSTRLPEKRRRRPWSRGSSARTWSIRATPCTVKRSPSCYPPSTSRPSTM